MWSARNGERSVVCLACGREVARSATREYDKYGDRWDRGDKEFEYLCKPCDADVCHRPRTGLEALLVDLEAGDVETTTFLAGYVAAVERRAERIEEES